MYGTVCSVIHCMASRRQASLKRGETCWKLLKMRLQCLIETRDEKEWRCWMNLEKMQQGGKTPWAFFKLYPVQGDTLQSDKGKFSMLKMMHIRWLPLVQQLLMPSCRGNGTTSWCYDGLLLVKAPHGSWRYLGGVSHDAPFPALGMTLPGQQLPICCSTYPSSAFSPLCRIVTFLHCVVEYSWDQFSAAACHPPCHGRLCNLPQKQTDTNFAPVLLAQSSS